MFGLPLALSKGRLPLSVLLLSGLLCLATPLPATQAQAAPSAAQEKTISLDVTAADLHAVMSMLERQADVKSSIRDGNPPYKPVYVHLENVSLTKALRAIAESAGAGVSLNAGGVYVFEPGGTTTIVPPSSAPAEKPVPKTKAPLNPADLHWQKLVLQHALPGDILKIMHWGEENAAVPVFPFAKPTTQNPNLPEGVTTIYALQSDNSLLIEATPEGFAKVRKIVKALDVAPRQVQIKAVFVIPTANDTEVQEMNNMSGKAASDLFTTLTQRGDKAVAAPSVTVANNVAANISLPDSIFSKLLADNHINNYDGFTPLITITPRIHSNETVTLNVQLWGFSILEPAPSTHDITQPLITLHTVGNGEMIAAPYPMSTEQQPLSPRLNDEPIISHLFRDDPANRRGMLSLLVFLTPTLLPLAEPKSAAQTTSTPSVLPESHKITP